MMNPVPWLQMTNMISYQGLVRTFPGYLIADLTLGNKNVYHEVGYLMGLNQGKGLQHENFLLLHNGGIGDSQTDVGFNLAAIKQLRVNDTNELREKVKQQIAVFYGLSPTALYPQSE
ncbi:hypothetical protein ACK3YH_12725 [Aeromonas caviae]|uniref:hypothetical protein n=3 Tax=Aeromonas caviae TaxID=648 RepID=UPI0006709073|nr:hypothetical protein ACH48_15960 [Aeromonas caviae]